MPTATQTLLENDVYLMQANIAWIGRADRSLDDLGQKWFSAACKAIDLVAEVMGNAEITSSEDRKALASIADMSYNLVRSLDKAIEAAPSPALKDMLEDLLCRVEDVAETATIAADEEFERAMDAEIKEFLNGAAEN